MINLAIEILWLLIGIICLAGVIWLVLYGIKTFVTPIPARLEQGIWFIVLLLCVIGALTILAGGGFHGHGSSILTSSPAAVRIVYSAYASNMAGFFHFGKVAVGSQVTYFGGFKTDSIVIHKQVGQPVAPLAEHVALPSHVHGLIVAVN